MSKFNLNSIIIYPENNQRIEKAIILLHGYGGDGKDISMLSYNWKRSLKNTLIICPDAHERCSINPAGFQWFDLSNDNINFIINESLKAEKKLKIFLDQIKEEYKLKNSDICLSGFSQGCMLSINVGITSATNFNCIVGFSGKIIDKESLSKRIKSRPNILLIHGDSDIVVPTSYLLDAKDFLLRHKINVKTKIIDNCEHNIPIDASQVAINFIKNNLFK